MILHEEWNISLEDIHAGITAVDEVRLERLASYTSRTAEEIQERETQLETSRRERRLVLVELRKE